MPTSKSPAPASAPPAPGRFIVVFGTKGGIGKTMVAINTAVGIAQRVKQPVCLVDLDVMAMGDVSKALNVTLPGSIVDLIPHLKRAAALAEAAPPVSLPIEHVIARHPSGVHVLGCFSNPRQLHQLDLKALALVFQELKRRYPYVVVDGGKGFSEALIAAFDAANLILLVATPDVITLYQTKWAVSMVESLLFPSMMIKAVLNRAESRGSIGTEDVRDVIPCDVIAKIPSDGRVVGTSMNQGVPLMTAFGASKVAEAVARLAEVLVSKPDLYLTHRDIPRHRQGSQGTNGALAEAGVTPLLASSRLFSTEGPTGPAGQPVDEIAAMKRRVHQRLVEELDLKRLDVGALANNAQMAELRRRVEPVIANLLAREVGGLISSHEVRSRLVQEIVDEALGLGPLEELLADPTVDDILVNNKDEVYVERRGKLELTTKRFLSNDQIRAVIERIVAPLGRRVDEANPMVDARLPDGSRINAIIPPLAIKGPVLSIRKFARVRYTLEDLIGFGSLSQSMAQFIRACVIARKNMIISGGTGSGKSTLLNVVSAFIPPGERILTIEDAAELKLAQPHWVSLEGRPANVEGRGAVTTRDLFRNALRMRPDRIIIGECRGAETLDMLQAMNTGHDGSITTVHANSPKDVVSRLDSMVLMSNVDLPIRAIREMIASAIHIIIHTARLSDGSRKIVAITELSALVNEIDLACQDLFVFQQTGVGQNGDVLGAFTATGALPKCLAEIKVKGIELDEAIFRPAPAAP